MRMTPATLHQFERGPNAVSHALALVARFIAEQQPACADVLPVVVEELVANLVDHGVYRGDGRIALAIEPAEGGVRVVLIDGCAPFDPRDAPDLADIPPERGGGCGLALVRAWAKILAYDRIDGRNRLELVVPG